MSSSLDCDPTEPETEASASGVGFCVGVGVGDGVSVTVTVGTGSAVVSVGVGSTDTGVLPVGPKLRLGISSRSATDGKRYRRNTMRANATESQKPTRLASGLDGLIRVARNRA